MRDERVPAQPHARVPRNVPAGEVNKGLPYLGLSARILSRVGNPPDGPGVADVRPPNHWLELDYPYSTKVAYLLVDLCLALGE